MTNPFENAPILDPKTNLTPAEKAALTRKNKLLALRPSIARFCIVTDKDAPLITISLDDGVLLNGHLTYVNNTLEKLGFKPVRITYNMLNREAGPIVIDADTPSYCDVGSEAYWSM